MKPYLLYDFRMELDLSFLIGKDAFYVFFMLSYRGGFSQIIPADAEEGK